MNAHTKSANERKNNNFKMGVGNDNRAQKTKFTVETTQTITTATMSTQSISSDLIRGPSINTKVTTSNSCNNSPLLSFETETLSKNAMTSKNDIGATPKITFDKNNKTPTTTIAPIASGTQSKVQVTRRERRPDRAVYVPRARRSQTTPPTTTAMTTNTETTLTIATNRNTKTNTNLNTDSSVAVSSVSSVVSSNHQKTNSVCAVSTTSSSKSDESIKKKSKTGGNGVSSSGTILVNNNNLVTAISTAVTDNIFCKDRRLERNNRKLIGPQKGDETKLSPKLKNLRDCDRQANDYIAQEDNQNKKQEYCGDKVIKIPSSDSTLALNPTGGSNTSIGEFVITTNEMNTTKNSLQYIPSTTSTLNHNGVQKMDDPVPVVNTKNSLTVTPISNILIEEVLPDEHNARRRHDNIPTKCDIDEQELQRASKEINRSNRRIMKQTFVSDILEIPEKIEPTDEINSIKTRSTHSTGLDSTTEDEEDDWESKFNENGDCLDPKILQELETAVGKVKITKPKSDYSLFLTNQSILNDEEFPHVLEVSNFPVEFRNQDLLMVFSQYKESGFDIKWVDDTHALAVFSSSRIAAEVLTMGHPFVMLKPLAEATMESRLKAKRCAGSLQPYRQRPQTCAALARRLVTGALGVRLETAAAERENEKRVLRKAKERKLLAAKQRDEAWES